MKTIRKALAIVSFTFMAVVQLYAQGYIAPNGVVYSGYTPGIGYNIDVVHDPTTYYTSSSTQLHYSPLR